MAIKINNIRVIGSYSTDINLYDLNNMQGTYEGVPKRGSSGISLSGSYGGMDFSGNHKAAISQGNTTITMPNYSGGAPRSGGNSGSNLNAHAGGGWSAFIDVSVNGYDITWPTEFKWPNDSEPDWTTARYWYVHAVCYSTSIIFATATPFDALST